ncbi:cell division-specific peptidoglycan biosynthesis regulator FtsW [Crenobacter luteus]|uniref:Probable peptidoglycan glycosyltransferase FtsW n=1 Tax=Crenobacter luteus TaxID=1452487 RepID=A0A161SAZ4_9NEIS|nr:putative lipid II flippase FtsW [Crenobacter luteus]KZE24940.1 cell division protein FtsW [Crenobacter luteus]TCP15139.1 cell division-specific peptidoglycan biosynthesis regulator FtsW [Crenobacter luteus]
MIVSGARRFSPVTAFDEALLWALALLLSISLVMVYSASIAYAEADPATNSRFFFLTRHLLFLGIGLVGAGAVFTRPTAWWQKHAGRLFLIGLVLLVAVLIPGIGKVVNGSRRWISLVVLNFQPSELMKFATVIYAADYTVRKSAKMHSVTEGFLPMLSAIVVVAFLLLMEPDFGALMVVMAIAMGILFLGGINLRIFGGLAVMAAAAIVLLIVTSPYRLKRVLGFMDPWEDPYGKGYQLSHSLIAIGRGEWFGVGLGGSVEKLFYLPEAHTDFIMAVISEEFGFVGILVVIGLYVWIVRRAFHIGVEAKKLERYYPALLAQGVGIWLGIQSFFNIGVNMGLLPTKGLTLPLMSFGGSAMLMNLVAVAVLVRVDWENRRIMRGYKV